ncbi:MAG: septum formation inhibitor Maf [Micromonosporaceae bacterium]|nr:septum formation inhibitor Maf [Micromonosporaceae bacterium]
MGGGAPRPGGGRRRAAGLDPTVIVSGVDESAVESTDARTHCAVLARLKAEAVANRLRGQRPAAGPAEDERTLVLGCDSVLEFEGAIHGKPATAEEAVARWRRMRSRIGTLHTGHCLVDVTTGTEAADVASTRVTFADVTDDEIAAYVATGEPQQVAGAFTIDGLGGWFVDRIDGDHSNVIGVSLPLVRRLLRELGLDVPTAWAGRPVRSA